MVNNKILRNGVWESDRLLIDERALVFHLSGKGLVVVSGCAHTGIINIIRYAQQITGVGKVFGVFGGFHLSGKVFEKRISMTVAELLKIGPELLCRLIVQAGVHSKR